MKEKVFRKRNPWGGVRAGWHYGGEAERVSLLLARKKSVRECFSWFPAHMGGVMSGVGTRKTPAMFGTSAML